MVYSQTGYRIQTQSILYLSGRGMSKFFQSRLGAEFESSPSGPLTEVQDALTGSGTGSPEER
jgi:hypothetical protein